MLFMAGRFFNFLKQILVKNKKGQAMVEYGLIIALVAVVLIVVIVALTGGLTEIFGEATKALKDPPTQT